MTTQRQKLPNEKDGSDTSHSPTIAASDEISRAILASREQLYAGRVALESALDEARTGKTSHTLSTTQSPTDNEDQTP
jgi:hypothetical protein